MPGEARSRSNGEMVLTERVLAGRYRLLGILGQGGMAVVHQAHDELLDRDVAVKVLRAGYAEDPEFVSRFRREARHAASLHHPNIVTIHDTGVDPETGSDYIVMQLVDGPDLARILERRGPLAIGFAVRIGIETAQALAYAHEHGITHRDIKPANILVDADGEIRVADFGIARAVTDAGATTAGTMIGSPQYASPEQVMGERVGQRSDLYSLGVVLYEALTGRRPFDGPSPAAVALERLRVKPRPLTSIDPTIPRPLEQIVMRLLERRPEARPASAGDVAAELDAFRARELGGVRRPGTRPRGAAAAVAAAATVRAPTQVTALPTPAEPEERRRRGAFPASLAAAVLAILLLITGTIGGILVLGEGNRQAGGVASDTFTPGESPGDVAVVPVASPTPSPLVTPLVTPVPTASPTPTPSAPPTERPVVRPSPKVTARPTARPTPRPTPRPASVAGPARDPAETVARFYSLVERHDYDAAAALWSPRMRRQYPPSRYIDGRFDATTRIDINRLRIQRMSVSSRTAVVAIDITEYRSSGSARRWVGSWDLVLINGAWLMDDPDLAAA
jgi:eukaryotic-like serine/threonine-protein kinase